MIDQDNLRKSVLFNYSINRLIKHILMNALLGVGKDKEEKASNKNPSELMQGRVENYFLEGLRSETFVAI